MKKYLIVLVILCGFSACRPGFEPKTVYVVRHAEKMTDKDDTELSEAGKLRAEHLSGILEDRDIRHVFSTPTRRTRTTAQPLANKNQLEILDYDVNDHDALVEEIKSREGNVLIVGHSNTIHHLLNYFVGFGKSFGQIEDSNYEDIFLIRLKTNGSMEVVQKSYSDYP